MGGEWWFVLKGDPASIDVKKYQTKLLKIQRKYRYDPRLKNSTWFNPTENLQEPSDNIFAKFTYECHRHKSAYNWHTKEPGVENSHNAWWVLYWDPTKFQKGYNPWSDIYARCAPWVFKIKSITMQRHLATKFPEHFQCYLGDGIGGCDDGDVCGGVMPEHFDSSDEDEIDRAADDKRMIERLLESI